MLVRVGLDSSTSPASDHGVKPLLCLLLVAGSAISCSSPAPRGGASTNPEFRGLAPERGSQSVPPTGRPLALIDSTAVSATAFDARLRETAGAVVLQEMALDSQIEKEFLAGSLTLPSSAVAQERSLLFATITADAAVGADQAGVLIERFRRGRGLGPRRFEDLLVRNAKLRVLVRQNGLVTSAELDAAIAADLAATVVARIIVTSGSQEAADARAEVESAPPGAERSAKFASLAFRMSRDASSTRGGVFGPVSPVDPSLPSLIRSALASGPGSLSPVLSVDAGFAVVLVESENPARPMPQGAELDRLREKVRTRKEREAMDSLSERLLAEATVTVTDESLKWSWDSRPRR